LKQEIHFPDPPTPFGEIRLEGKVNNNDPLTKGHPLFINAQFRANPKPSSCTWHRSGPRTDSTFDLQVFETNEVKSDCKNCVLKHLNLNLFVQVGLYNVRLGIKNPTDLDFENVHLLNVTNEIESHLLLASVKNEGKNLSIQ
jgi:hypothetical protein